jgi:hypothetical protein
LPSPLSLHPGMEQLEFRMPSMNIWQLCFLQSFPWMFWLRMVLATIVSQSEPMKLLLWQSLKNHLYRNNPHLVNEILLLFCSRLCHYSAGSTVNEIKE